MVFTVFFAAAASRFDIDAAILNIVSAARTPMTATVRRARALVVPLVLVATLLTAAPATAIGHAGMPHASPEYNTLFAHYDQDSEEWYLATITGEDVGYVGGIGTSGPGQTYNWTVPLDAPLSGDLVLDPEQNVELYAYIGRTGTGGVGRVTVETTLTVGETVVAAGSGEAIVYAHEYQEIHWSVAPQVDRIPADGGDVVWTISVTDGVRNGIFLRINDPDGAGASRIELPITGVDAGPAEPEFVAEDLTGEKVDLTLSFADGTNAVHQYNWTARGEAYDLEYGAAIENGTVGVHIDADGIVVLNETYDADVSGSVEGADLVGDITIRLMFTEFRGGVVLRIAPPPAEPVAEPDQVDLGGNETADAADANETGGEDGGFLPGFGPVAATLGVLAAAVVARRRRA